MLFSHSAAQAYWKPDMFHTLINMELIGGIGRPMALNIVILTIQNFHPDYPFCSKEECFMQRCKSLLKMSQIQNWLLVIGLKLAH